jgi:hypothetical protein
MKEERMQKEKEEKEKIERQQKIQESFEDKKASWEAEKEAIKNRANQAGPPMPKAPAAARDSAGEELEGGEAGPVAKVNDEGMDVPVMAVSSPRIPDEGLYADSP